jgi:Bacterial protein of unknown function (DUF885)
MRFWRTTGVCSLAVLALAVAGSATGETRAAATDQPAMSAIIQQYAADNRALEATYSLELSDSHMHRFAKFYADELSTLDAIDFNHLAREDQVDYLLLRNLLISEEHQLTIRQKQIDEMAPLLPFEKKVEALIDAKRMMQRPDGEKSAATLAAITKQIEVARKQLDPGPHTGSKTSNAGPGNAGAENARPDDAKQSNAKPKIDPVVANRALLATSQLRDALHEWFSQYNSYDPVFTWWVDQPYREVDKALKGYSDFLKEKLVGIAPEDKTTIIGDPVGRDALLAELQDNVIPYTPEELIAIAQTEYDWCMKEMLKASHEMGFGDDWHAAVEKVKSMHVAPGEQPELIRKLVVEGDEFVKKNDLVTVPPLADESWRMIMMTPQRQLVNPFFTGGNEISVSYPTDTMSFDQREMSMKGNNIPFARATAFHEMIPGHFLQFYMSARYHPYRRSFSTPFWGEGNAFYWEMVFWDKGFERTPEERVGALVWRMHRSARVIFTMNFHLGKWTPQQCVQFLIDAVGFEPDNATAEVRRSFDGSVGPLYQCAYLTGALQFRAMRHELVDSGKMSERQFHDAILHENSMPIELLRADLENLKLARDYKTNWEYYGPHPTHP